MLFVVVLPTKEVKMERRVDERIVLLYETIKGERDKRGSLWSSMEVGEQETFLVTFGEVHFKDSAICVIFY